MKKLSYPREDIDNRQENTIPLPICFQNAMYAFDISHFANKWKRGCIFLSIVDLFAGLTPFFTLAFIAFCDQTHYRPYPYSADCCFFCLIWYIILHGHF